MLVTPLGCSPELDRARVDGAGCPAGQQPLSFAVPGCLAALEDLGFSLERSPQVCLDRGRASSSYSREHHRITLADAPSDPGALHVFGHELCHAATTSHVRPPMVDPMAEGLCEYVGRRCSADSVGAPRRPEYTRESAGYGASYLVVATVADLEGKDAIRKLGRAETDEVGCIRLAAWASDIGRNPEWIRTVIPRRLYDAALWEGTHQQVCPYEESRDRFVPVTPGVDR